MADAIVYVDKILDLSTEVCTYVLDITYCHVE